MQKSSLEQRDAEKNAGVHHMLLVSIYNYTSAHIYLYFYFYKDFPKIL